ncbi:MAG: hypothetical protein J7605_01915 [Variovorax sp.]|nr:hypothetical protein [Variovorax sp.]
MSVVASWAKWLIAIALIIQLGIYANDVHTRMSGIPDCTWYPVKSRFQEPKPPHPYSGRYCYIAKDTILLQLFDAEGQQLLVERMYFSLDGANLFWNIDREGHAISLIYDTYEGGRIHVPPTLLDRLRAKLP